MIPADETFDGTWIRAYSAPVPAGPLVTLPGVGHYCQEDAPETLVSLIEQFIQTNFRFMRWQKLG